MTGQVSEERLSESATLNNETIDQNVQRSRETSHDERPKSSASSEESIGAPVASGPGTPKLSITQYAALLQQLPIFEPFKHDSDTISEKSVSLFLDEESELEAVVRQTSFRGHRREISTRTTASPSWRGGRGKRDQFQRQADIPSDPSAERTRSSALVFYGGIDNGSMLLPGIRQVDKERRDLLATQLEVEDVERQMSQARVELAEEISMLLQVSRSDEISHEAARNYIQVRLSIVSETLSRTEREEEDLQTRQRRVTYLHSQLNTAIESLYALMTNGARLGDSEADVEDQMFENAALATRFSHRSNSLRKVQSSTEAEKAPVLSTPEHFINSQIASNLRTTGQEIHPRRSSDYGPNDLGEPNVSQQHRGRQTARVSGRTKHITYKATDSQALFLRCVGEQFIAVELDALRVTSSANPLLSASENVRAIRERDLEPELSLDPDLTIWTTAEAIRGYVPASTRRGFIQKASDINVPSLHLNDLISMWSLSMSQNSWTDIHRTSQYRGAAPGKKRPLSRTSLGILESHKYSRNVTDFLRELWVHNYPKKFSFLKASSHSSVRVEPDCKFGYIRPVFVLIRYLSASNIIAENPVSGKRNNSYSHAARAVAKAHARSPCQCSVR